MKKQLLIGLAAISAQLSFAQLSPDGTSMLIDYGNGSSNCFFNSAPNNGGIAANGATIQVLDPNSSPTAYHLADGTLTLPSVADVTTGNGGATWFSIPAVDLQADACVSASAAGLVVDLSSTGNGKIQVTAEADIDGATLEIFLGGPGAFFPSSSTFNTGDGSSIIASHTFTAANTEETYTIDLEAIDQTVWDAWGASDSIQALGFRSQTNDAVFKISSIQIGSEVVGLFERVRNEEFQSYPNPANQNLNIELGNNESIASYQLMNLTSEVVLSESLTSANNTASLNTNNLKDGVYMLQITSTSGNILSKKVVIKH